MTTSAGVYLLATDHAEAIQRLAADATFAAVAGVAHPPAATAGFTMVARAADERVAGRAYWYAVADRGDVKGVAALQHPYSDNAQIQAWIDPASRHRGYGTLAVRMVLEFAFRNLQLRHVTANAPVGDIAAERTLAKFGFAPALDPAASAPVMPNAGACLTLTRDDWISQRDRPAVAALRADLRAILDAELAAGNEVVESGGGWPDTDSIFIRLRDPFRTTPSPLPDDVVYTEPNDPHWWKADFSSRSAPRHILAC